MHNLMTQETFSSKLNLVDLAGSECVGRSGVTGEALQETKFVNKSLSALGDVLGALAEKRLRHIPYRNSKLTHLLQDCLGQHEFFCVRFIVYFLQQGDDPP